MNTFVPVQPVDPLQVSYVPKAAFKFKITSPQKLHQEFVKLGSLKLKLKNKMLAMLPEIYKSGIYKKYAGSIVEYAGKYGDIAKTTVIKRLRLEENLHDKPCLKAAIGIVGVHKVAMVAKIATPEMDKAMAENLLNMSKMAVQSLSKELRAWQDKENASDQQRKTDDGRQSALDGLLNDFDSANQNQSQSCRAVSLTKKIELDEESTFIFLKLKAKLGKNLSDKEFLKLILEERVKQEFSEQRAKKSTKKQNVGGNSFSQTQADPKSGATDKISDQKSVTGETFHADENHAGQPVKTAWKLPSVKVPPTETRYIRADKKRQIISQTNGKCVYPNCNAPYEVLHHTDRYSDSKNHDSVIPLCRIHHEFAHNNLIQNEILGADQWKLSMIHRPDTKISNADILYRKYYSEALA